MSLGPFDMTVERVEALSLQFTEFINRLLLTESKAAGISGDQLTINKLETVADGGVDAVTSDATSTDWIPGGTTAWQFKRADLSPAECDAELRGATWAHE